MYYINSKGVSFELMTLGQKIKQLRRFKGWSQEQTADKLKIGLLAYGKIERDVTDITISRLNQLSKLFGVDPAELVSTQIETLRQKVAQQDAEILALQKELLEYLKKEKKK
jgi:transcriptional regulator with XRE-family HTH domain